MAHQRFAFFTKPFFETCRSQRIILGIQLPGDEERRFLEDGDEVILRGFCEADGHARIGFGECRGVVGSTGADGA